MNNKEKDRFLYRYPNSQVLKNKLSIRDKSLLDTAERQLFRLRVKLGNPIGNFDLNHLQAIHKH